MESRGVPAVVISTVPFRGSIEAASRALGLPEINVLYLKHPFGTLTPEEVERTAEQHMETIVEALTAGGGKDGD